MLSERIEIWNEGEYNGADENYIPYMQSYILDGEKVRGAVLICPGGGYGFVSPREGEPIALKFNSAGYHAFVLYYSVEPNRHPQPIYDVTRAMCIIRERAEEYKIDSNKIAVAGFSAGGHLAASLGVFWNQPYLLDLPRMEPGKNKPNALILAYAVTTSGEKAHRGTFKNLLGENASEQQVLEMSLEKQVTDAVPPSFLWHTFTDGVVPVENTLQFANALREKGVEFEMHIYPHGVHGLSLANEEVCSGKDIMPHVATWIDLCRQWLDGLFKEVN